MTSLFRTTSVLQLVGDNDVGYSDQGFVHEVKGSKRNMGGMGETDVVKDQE
jgi:hypothetical protein